MSAPAGQARVRSSAVLVSAISLCRAQAGTSGAQPTTVWLLFTPKMVWVEAPFIKIGSAPERVDLGHEGLPSCLNSDTLPEERDEKPFPHRQCKGDVS